MIFIYDLCDAPFRKLIYYLRPKLGYTDNISSYFEEAIKFKLTQGKLIVHYSLKNTVVRTYSFSIIFVFLILGIRYKFFLILLF